MVDLRRNNKGVVMTKGIGKMTDLSNAIASKSRDTDKEIGYLLRAVEDLSNNLNGHMRKEEEDRKESKKDFEDYKAEDRAEKREMKTQISKLTTGLTDLKRFIFIVVLGISLGGVVLDKLEPSHIVSLFATISKVFL